MFRRLRVAIALVLVATMLSACGIAVPDVTGMTLERAQKALSKAGFKAGEVTYDEAAKGAPGLVVEQDPAAGERVDEDTPVDLTLAGAAPAPVPGIVGLSKDEAEAALLAAGFRLGAVTESYSPTAAAGSVVYQQPAGDSEAPAGSAVDVIVSRGTEPVTVVPVTGKMLAEARKALEAAGLEVATTERADAAAKGTVLAQSPKAGSEVPPGSVVELEVSSGVIMVRVPDIRGMYSSDADRKLRISGLVPNGVGIHGPIESDAADIGKAYRVIPPPGTLVPKGSEVSYHFWWESS